MQKTPIAIALERQIPEYIRGEYELFVDFIKAYYEFLDQTQQRNLEDIRSIENTLDEFIIRFKKELSVLFPTNSLENERFILQRIREFYQARGSKESFQFLFKILFNKESDIFYPSTQILRASDGKWIEEKSVFVKSTSGNLFELSGKNINIQTSKKKISVFCPRVVLYKNDTYEVFINRSYIQDISVGDTVSSEDELNYGEVLPCPNKYTITTKGSGFEIGQLYYLKTERGDGSLIKITKIGTGGSIEKVQVISFGLDYDSTFYAKLSNKQAVALPYYHPVTSINGSTPTPPYPDGNNGFIDYGYINRQDYFYFDKFYTPSVSNDQNVFYADGTYVGEIIGSFYTNASNTNVIDADTAEIKIQLGAVAVYPGYYETSDGFISDESYIQDGRYYQLFSYVIKVEQQVDSYRDIVKALLHPAGMELFAEYTIKNNYLVSAAPLLAFIRRQFLDQQFVTDDDGTNSVLKVVPSSESISIAIHNLLQDIKNVQLRIQKYSPEGDLMGETDQRRWSTVDPIIFNLYDMSKGSALDPIENSVPLAYHSGSEDIKDSIVLVRRYDSSGNLTTETDQRRWSVVDNTDGITNKDNTLLIRRYDSSGNLTSETDQRRWSVVNHTDEITNKNSILSIRKYDSSGTLTGETDQRRWSTVDPVNDAHFFSFQSIENGTFYKTVVPVEADSKSTTVLIRRYDSDGNLTSETDQRRWSFAIPVNAGHDFAFTSEDGGAFFKTTSTTDAQQKTTTVLIRKYDSSGNLTNETDQRRWSVVDSTDLYVLDPLITPEKLIALPLGRRNSTDTANINDGLTTRWSIGTSIDEFTRVVIYDRSTIPLVSLDPAVASDIFVPTSELPHERSTIVIIPNTRSLFTAVDSLPIIGTEFQRAPDLTFTANITAGSSLVTLVGKTTGGIQIGRILTKVSGTGVFGVGTVRVNSIDSETTFSMNINASVTGSITFVVIGETPELADVLSSPIDSFPNGLSATESNPNAKFTLSGASWRDTLNTSDSYSQVNTYDRRPEEFINNSNIGTLYFNVYSQDTSNPLSSYSYEAESYSERITRSLS